MKIALATDPAQLLQGGMFALARGTLIEVKPADAGNAKPLTVEMIKNAANLMDKPLVCTEHESSPVELFLSDEDRRARLAWMEERERREEWKKKFIRWANVQLAEARFRLWYGGKKP